MRSAHAVIAHTLVILCNFSEKIFAKNVMQCQCVHQRRCVCIPHKNEIIMHCVSCWLASLQMHTVHLHSWLQSWKMMSEEAQWMLIMTRLLLDLVDHSLMSMWYARHLQVLAVTPMATCTQRVYYFYQITLIHVHPCLQFHASHKYLTWV